MMMGSSGNDLSSQGKEEKVPLSRVYNKRDCRIRQEGKKGGRKEEEEEKVPTFLYGRRRC